MLETFATLPVAPPALPQRRRSSEPSSWLTIIAVRIVGARDAILAEATDAAVLARLGAGGLLVRAGAAVRARNRTAPILELAGDAVLAGALLLETPGGALGARTVHGRGAGEGATDANHSNLLGYNAGSSFADNNIGSNNIKYTVLYEIRHTSDGLRG